MMKIECDQCGEFFPLKEKNPPMMKNKLCFCSTDCWEEYHRKQDMR